MISTFSKRKKVVAVGAIAFASLIGLTACTPAEVNTDTSAEETRSTESAKPAPTTPIKPPQTTPNSPADQAPEAKPGPNPNPGNNGGTPDVGNGMGGSDVDAVVVPIEMIRDGGASLLESVGQTGGGSVSTGGSNGGGDTGTGSTGPGSGGGSISDGGSTGGNTGGNTGGGTTDPGTGGSTPGGGTTNPGGGTTDPGTGGNPGGGTTNPGGGTTNPGGGTTNPGGGTTDPGTTIPTSQITRPDGLNPIDVTPEEIEAFIVTYNNIRVSQGMAPLSPDRFYISTLALSDKVVNFTELYVAGNLPDNLHKDAPYNNEVAFNGTAGTTSFDIRGDNPAVAWWNSSGHRNILYLSSASNNPDMNLMVSFGSKVDGNREFVTSFASWVDKATAEADGVVSTSVSSNLVNYELPTVAPDATYTGATIAPNFSASRPLAQAPQAPADETDPVVDETEPVVDETEAMDETAPVTEETAPAETEAVDEAAPVAEETAPAEETFEAAPVETYEVESVEVTFESFEAPATEATDLPAFEEAPAVVEDAPAVEEAAPAADVTAEVTE